MNYKLLPSIKQPQDIKELDFRQLARLAAEIRHYITETTALCGGHLASNLGVVELTLALHLTFDSPRDQIVFDVSHQTYVHKLLTGRFEQFATLRQFGGLSGFAKRSESPHDIFNAGHASTSLSAAYGLAKARDLKGLDHHVIAVIGDGALSGGMAYEALNNIGHDHTKMIIILNDNDMSIDKNVGSINKYLGRLRTTPSYYKAKRDVHSVIDNIPAIGKPIASSISRVKESFKQLLVSEMLFEELGVTYIGVADGHDIVQLSETLERLKNVEGPVLLHVKTKKGKGVAYAERYPDRYHGVKPFDVATGKAKVSAKTLTFSDVFGKTICQLAAQDKAVCAITAAMPSGTGLKAFAKLYPRRFFDVGIAEGHAVTFAAGLAVNGVKPYFAVYSTFLQRGYDQLIHDVCLQNLPVVFCIDRAGLVGNDGETHHGIFDLSYLLSVPNLTVYAPKDGADLKLMMALARNATTPVAIRYPRGSCYNAELPAGAQLTDEFINKGDQFSIIAVGTMYHVARQALDILAEQGYYGRLITPKQLKPLRMNSILNNIIDDKPLFTLEDNSAIGGFGSYLSYCLANAQQSIKLQILAIDDCFVPHGSVDQLMNSLQLDAAQVAERILKQLRANS